ncbi:MAG: hypothetical protein IKQ10_07070 [Oscillospiraceae bacterium]|nr:hypothetical protein [Oscillospiraceae bacterium]
MSSGARALARASLAAALGTAVLYLGSLLPGGKLALLCVASLGVVFVKMSCPGFWAPACYFVTALLSLLLLPNKAPAILYAVFVGYYPLVKLRAERFAAPVKRWALKLGVFAAAMLALWLLSGSFAPAAEVFEGAALWIVFAAAAAAFFAYDFALGQLILYYLRNIAGRIK